MLQNFNIYSKPLSSLPEGKLLINTINAHSYNVSRSDAAFAAALQASDVLLPDGVSVVWAIKMLRRAKSQEPRVKTEEDKRAKSQEPRAKSQEPRVKTEEDKRAKSQEPRTKSQESRQKTEEDERTKSKEQRQKTEDERQEIGELKKIAGEDLFYWEMERLEQRAKNKEQRAKNKEQRQKTEEDKRVKSQEPRAESLGADERNTVMFLGSSEAVLAKIKARAAVDFPHVEVHTYSPPYKPAFDAEDNKAMIAAINSVQPDVLFVGMTAPKQEKWAHEHFAALQVGHVCCIGAVFDFYAGTVQRAPQLFINLGLEWFYRLAKEPRRMWRRYLIGNVKFVWAVIKEKLAPQPPWGSKRLGI